MSARAGTSAIDTAAGLRATPVGRRTAWGLAAALAVANAAGYAFDLYARFWWFDRVLHAATIFALTYWSTVFVLRRVLTGVERHRPLLAVTIACVGVAVGAWWEVAEWGFDRVAPGDVIKGKYDTIIDLVVDTLGAALGAWLSLSALRPAGVPNGGVPGGGVPDGDRA